MSTRLFEQVRRGAGDDDPEELSYFERTMRKTVVSARFSHNELIHVQAAPPAPDEQVGVTAWVDRAEALAVLGSEHERATRALRSEIDALEAAVAHEDLSVALRVAPRAKLQRQAAQGDGLALQMATIAGVRRGASSGSASSPSRLPAADLLARLATAITSLRRLKDATPWTVRVGGGTRTCPSKRAEERLSSLLGGRGLLIAKQGRRASGGPAARGRRTVLDVSLDLQTSRSSEGYTVAQAGAAAALHPRSRGPAILSVTVPKETQRWASRKPALAAKAACNSMLPELAGRLEDELGGLLGLYSPPREGEHAAARPRRSLHEAVPTLALAGLRATDGARHRLVARGLEASLEEALVATGRFSVAPAARRILHGTLTRVPGGVAVDLRMVALASGSVEETATATCGTRDGEMVECAGWLAAKLAGLPLPRLPVALSNRGQEFAIAPPALESSSVPQLDPDDVVVLIEQWLLGHGLRVTRPGERAVVVTTRVRGHDLGQVRGSGFRSVRCDIDLAALHRGNKIASAAGSATRAHLDAHVAFRDAAEVAVAAAMARLLPSVERARRTRREQEQ